MKRSILHPLQVFWRPWEKGKSEPKLCLSPISPDPHLRRKIKPVKKRSLGDLARRRKRLSAYQNNKAYPFPHTPPEQEPERSRLESWSWVGGPRRLDWSRMSEPKENPSSSQSGWSSSTGWMYSPSPGLPPGPSSPSPGSPPWLPSHGTTLSCLLRWLSLLGKPANCKSHYYCKGNLVRLEINQDDPGAKKSSGAVITMNKL